MASPWQEIREALEAVLTEAGLQAHKHGCPHRLKRPARWDESKPCAGCKADAALARLSELEAAQEFCQRCRHPRGFHGPTWPCEWTPPAPQPEEPKGGEKR